MRAMRVGLLFVSVALLSAQTDRGMIGGTVKDPNGGALPGVVVTARHIDTNTRFTAASNESGDFNLPSLPVGLYQVRAEKTGFKTAIHDNVRIETGMTVRLDTNLDMGAVQQTVIVSAEVSALRTDDAKVMNTVDDVLIEGLPTVMSDNMRSPFDLAGITAGVNGGDQDFRIGGGQAASFGVMLDGSSANTNRAGSTLWAAVNAPSLDAITQFAVETNGFKAEFGRAGGGLVTFVSKSGTNQYHGTGFDFIRNNAFDARGFFNKTVPVYRQHDFGGTFGGPLSIPKLYNGKNRTFFFLSYEGFRNRAAGSTSVTALPPAEFYKGDFSNAVSRTRAANGSYIRYNVFDPDTTRFTSPNYVRDPFPGNIVPLSRFDPLSRKILDIAQSSLTSDLRTDVVPGTPEYWLENYWQSGTSINPNDKFSAKFDHVLSGAHRLSAYVAYSKRQRTPGPSGAPGIPGILNPFQALTDTAPVYRGSWDATISSRLHNRFYLGINQFHDNNFPLSEGGNWQNKLCIPNVPACDRNLPIVNINDFPVWGGSGFNGSENVTYSFNDDLSWTKGKHIFKMGYLYEFAPYVGLGQQNGAGNATFTTAMTALPAQNNRNTGGGLGFASMALGYASTGAIHTPRRVGMKWRYNAMYFQDDWRVGPKLTLNLGMRYEYNLPAINEDSKCADFDPALPNPGASGRLGALVFCGTGPGRIGRESIPPGWYRGFGPRFGLSWLAARKTVVRMSGGISYAPVKSITGSGHFQGFAQILTFPDQTGGIEPVFKMEKGMPPWPVPPFIDPAFGNNGDVDWWQGRESNRLPQQLSWTITLQRELKGNLLLEAGYTSMSGSHLVANLLNYNQIDNRTLPANVNIFTNSGRTLLNTTYDNSNRLVLNSGYAKPYAEFPGNFTLARGLRPYPQYNNVSTANGGDHSGHSSYHSLLVKVTRRYSKGLVVDASYVLSKMFTDSDSMWGSGAALDHYNRRLEKALSANDRTHEAKFNYVYDLPIGPRKRFLNRGILSQVIGGWRVGATHRYSSGVPMSFSGAFGFPVIGNRPTITQYEDWRGPVAGDKFDPSVDRYFKAITTANWSGDTATITSEGFFPLQLRDRMGNMTKTNPKMRNFPLYSENISLAKTFLVSKERRTTADLRFEGFNPLNRTQFGTPNTNITDTANFGLVRTQANTPRRMQFALKLTF
ncbi:MAG: TonB-dependent receptor [Candidatus Solibacter usitatus]|nr:TonB-dependent receptor [Candidatus Solibacter usitatus]